MARRSEERRPQKKSGAGAAIAALGVLGVLVAIVVVGIMAGKKADKRNEVPEVVVYDDPFEGLEEDGPVTRKKPVASRGFSGMDFESQAAEWVETQELQTKAAELHSKSSDLRLEGDAEWRTAAKEAKVIYEEVMEKARAYRVIYAGEFGEDSAATRRLDKKIDIWNRSLMGLHKTVG